MGLSMRFVGVVGSGTGEAAAFLNRAGYRRQFERRLGFAPFPGTLNVSVVPEQVEMIRALRAKPGIFIEAFEEEGRKFWPVTTHRATLHGHAVAILFPERSRHGPELLELVSPENLREKLKLKDGDRVEIIAE